MTTGFGVFGKIPNLGDFLRVNLPVSFVQAWDTWLQDGMTHAKSALGPMWNEAYLSAPIWRFSVPQGVAGTQAMSGILMASVDQVGRQYPLTLAIPHSSDALALSHFANRTVFETLEEIALAALDDAFGRDDLLNALTSVQWISPNPSVMQNQSYVGAHPAAQSLAAQSIDASYGQCALWSAMLEGNHRLLLTKSLPKSGELTGLFDLSAPVWTQTRPSLVM